MERFTQELEGEGYSVNNILPECHTTFTSGRIDRYENVLKDFKLEVVKHGMSNLEKAGEEKMGDFSNEVIRGTHIMMEPEKRFSLHPTFTPKEFEYLKEAIALNESYKSKKNQEHVRFVEDLISKMENLKGDERGDNE